MSHKDILNNDCTDNSHMQFATDVFSEINDLKFLILSKKHPKKKMVNLELAHRQRIQIWNDHPQYMLEENFDYIHKILGIPKAKQETLQQYLRSCGKHEIQHIIDFICDKIDKLTEVYCWNKCQTLLKTAS